MAVKQSTCSVPHCSRIPKSGSQPFCEPHYRQNLANRPIKEPRKSGRWVGHVPPDCAVHGCGRDHFAKGHCAPHYNQLKRGIKPGKVRERRSALARDAEGRKQCRSCDAWKPVENYAKNSRTKDLLLSICRECHSGYYRRNSAQIKLEALAARYSVSVEDVQLMKKRPCAICGGTDNPVIDHDHSCCPGEKSCGKCIRGTLCSPCNVGLGAFADDSSRLENAIAYLADTSFL